MPRQLAVFLLLVLSAPAFAQQASVRVTVTVDKPTVVSGEPIEVTVVVTKPGLSSVTDAKLSIDFTRGSLFLDTTVPEGWTCIVASGRGVQCTTPELKGDTPAAFVARGFAPDHLEPWDGGAAVVYWLDAQGVRRSARKPIPLTIQAAASLADLTTALEGPGSLRIGEVSHFTLTIGNEGPADVSNVWIHIATSNETADSGPEVSGSGWSCTQTNGGTVCMRPSIRVDETSVLTIDLPGIATAGGVTLYTRIFAEKSHDPDGWNSYELHQISVGNAEDYERVLIPLAPSLMYGAEGSRWRTEVHAFIDSETPIAHYRTCVDDPICMPFMPPLRRPFPVGFTGFIARARLQSAGSFAAFDRGVAAKVTFNIRVHDESRDAETWGTEISAVHETEFRTGRIVLMPLPVNPTLRHTLRIYSDGLLPVGEVLVRVLTGDAREPLATSRQTLVTPPGSFTPAQLAVSPGFAQLDPLALIERDLTGIEEFWIEVEPLTPGLRFWAFAALTNNETSQVMTVTPQP